MKEAIEMRRSIRRFRPNDVPDELIKEEEVKKELRRVCLEQRFVEEAPVVIICFDDHSLYLACAI